MQTKKKSLSEALANTFIGLVISYMATMVIYYLMEIQVSHKQNTIITLTMLVISIVRGYFIRRLFNNYNNNIEKIKLFFIRLIKWN